MNQYKVLHSLGVGAFGAAFLAIHKQQNKQYVIKQVALRNKSSQQKQQIFHQVKLLQQFKHVNIVSYKDSFIDKNELLNIVMEYCESGDMNQLIQNSKGNKIQQSKIIYWISQIALAIFYMHDKKILHRDLKTPNIFLTEGHIRLGDFGISKVLDHVKDLASTNIGTPYYMSPEQYNNKPYSYKSDIWAFGCILYQMCNQRRPFQAGNLNSLGMKVIRSSFAPVSQCYSKDLRDLITVMLSKNPAKRPNIIQILSKPFIKRKTIQYIQQIYSKKSQIDKQVLQSLLNQAKHLGIFLQQKKQIKQNLKEATKNVTKAKVQEDAQKLKAERQKVKQKLQQELKKYSQQRKQMHQKLKQIQEEKKNIKQISRKVSQKNLNRPASGINSNRVSRSPSVKDISKGELMQQKQKNQYSELQKKKPKLQQIDIKLENQKSSKKQTIKIEEKQIINQIKQDKKGSQLKQYQAKQTQIKKQQPKQEKKGEQKPVFKMEEQYDMQFQDYQNDDPEDQNHKQKNNQQFQKLLADEVAQIQRVVKESNDRVDKIQNPNFKKSDQQKRKNDQQKGSYDKQQYSIKQMKEKDVQQLKEQIKLKTNQITTIRNQLSNIDFEISSDSEPEQTRQFNPQHVKISDRINTLKENVVAALGAQKYNQFYDNLHTLRQKKRTIKKQDLIQMLEGKKIGYYHIVKQIDNLSNLLAKIPKWID